MDISLNLNIYSITYVTLKQSLLYINNIAFLPMVLAVETFSLEIHISLYSLLKIVLSVSTVET